MRDARAGSGDRKPREKVLTLHHAKFASVAGRSRGLGAIRRLAGSAVLRDAAVLGSGAAVAQLILFLAAPVFLRLYRPSDFGLYSFAYSTLSLLATLGTWKIERLIIIVPSRETAIRLLTALIVIAIASAVLLTLLALPLQLMGDVLWELGPSEKALLLAGPPGMLMLVVSAGFRNLAIRTRRFKAAAAARILRGVVFAAGTIATGLTWHASSGNGALLMLSWQIAADGCALLVQIGANRREASLILFRPRFRRSLSVLKQHGKTVGTLAFSQLVNSINLQLPISTITFAYGAIFAGWYSLANQFVAVPTTMVTLAVSDVVNQRLARLHAERKPFAQAVLRTILGMAAAGAAPFAAIIFLGPPLLPIVLGGQWIDAARSVSILAVSTYLFFIVNPVATVALMVDARRYMLLWACLRLAALTGLGAAALRGLISYDTWLALYVTAHVLLYLVEAVSEWLFARNAEARWRTAPRC